MGGRLSAVLAVCRTVESLADGKIYSLQAVLSMSIQSPHGPRGLRLRYMI